MTGRSVHPEHAIQCPRCGAGRGIRCTTPRGRKLGVPSHDARINAWTTAPTAAQEERP